MSTRPRTRYRPARPPSRFALPGIAFLLFLAPASPVFAQARFTSTFRAFVTGDGPNSVAAGDMNGDGKQDLVVANYLASTVSILLGDGAGEFGPKNDLDTGLDPTWVEVADLDNDGRLDIVVANSDDGSVSVILRTGTGGYRTKEDYVVGTGTWGLAVGDFAGDARPDIAAAADPGGVALLVNAGDGTFGVPSYLPALGASELRLADLNADTKLDLVSANYNIPSIYAWIWTGGPGIFGERADYVSTAADDIEVGDVSGDGVVDLVAVARSDPGKVMVLPGTGGGVFGAATDYPCGAYPSAVRLADLDEDLDLDVVVANSSGTEHTITTYRNFSGPSLGTRKDFEAGWAPYALEMKDVNGDSRPDAIAACSFTDVVSVLLADGDGGFGTATSYVEAAEPHLVTLADLNGDSRLDAVTAHLGPGAVAVRLGLVGGTFGSPSYLVTGTRVMQVAAGDLNADGKPDLAATDTLSDQVSVMLGNGNGTFLPAATHGTGSIPGGVAIADVTGDGKADVIVTNRVSDNVSVFPGDGSGGLGTRADHPVGSGPFSLAIGDLNADLKQDLVVGCREGGGDVMVMLGTGGGTFAAPVPYHVGRRVQSVALGYVNDDAILDLVAASYVDLVYDQDFLGVYLGAGDGTFGAPSEIPTASHPYSVAIADVDGDTITDLLAAGMALNAVAMHRGVGGGTFQPRLLFGAGNQTTGLAIGDVTGDGRPDLVTASYNLNGPGSLVVLRNLLPVIVPPPVISTIAPASGGNAGSVSVQVGGASFQAGATVTLERGGQPDIAGSEIVVSLDGSSLSATFDIAGAAVGAWDVVITNPDAETSILMNGFTIEGLEAPQLRVDLLGPARMRANRLTAFDVVIQNTGNVDAVATPLWITGVPAAGTVQADFLVTPVPQQDGEPDWSLVPQTFTSPNGRYLSVVIPRIPPGVLTRRFSISVPSGTPNFILGAAVTPPWEDRPELRSCMAAVIASPSCMSGVLEQAEDTLLNRPDLEAMGGSGVWAKVAWNCEGATTLLSAQAEAEQALDYMVAAVESGATGLCAEALLPRWRDTLEVNLVFAVDPSVKHGPDGIISDDQGITYTVHFENEESSNGSAQLVVVTDVLDLTKLDPATVKLEAITIGNETLPQPTPGVNTYRHVMDLRPTLQVEVTATVEPVSGVLRWTFTSIDPATGLPPLLDGFLPPNVNPPQGEGSVMFTVYPIASIADGAEIRNYARVKFDDEPLETTAETVTRMDAVPVSSSVDPIASPQDSSRFTVHWTGVGAELKDYTIYVSKDGGRDTTWKTETTLTSGTFVTELGGHRYDFYSRARDIHDNVEPKPTTPDASIVSRTTGVDDAPSLQLALEGARPNPAIGRMRVGFTLPGRERAVLELMDVAGRRIARREVGSLGPGRHVVEVAPPRLAAGLYFLRLQLEGHPALTARAVVLDGLD